MLAWDIALMVLHRTSSIGNLMDTSRAFLAKHVGDQPIDDHIALNIGLALKTSAPWIPKTFERAFVCEMPKYQNRDVRVRYHDFRTEAEAGRIRRFEAIKMTEICFAIANHAISILDNDFPSVS